MLRFVAWLRSEAVRRATLAGGLLALSPAYKLERLELLSMIARFVATQNEPSDMDQRLEAFLRPGDQGHSSLHEVVECVPP